LVFQCCTHKIWLSSYISRSEQFFNQTFVCRELFDRLGDCFCFLSTLVFYHQMCSAEVYTQLSWVLTEELNF
jgi:hypothetical protein